MCRNKLNKLQIYQLEKSQEEVEEKKIDELTYKYGTKLAKLIKLCKYILTDNNNKIIIFSLWNRLLEMIGKVLKTNNVHNVFCKGNVHQKNAAINSFRKGGSNKKYALCGDFQAYAG